MINENAKTIQIFLPTGEPRGIRIAELTTRIIQAISIPRTALKKVNQRPEMDHLAVYFLFGDSDEGSMPAVYIGQTEDSRNRLGTHNKLKDFWKTAVAIISKTHSFTQAHLRYLEWYCIQKAQAVGRYRLENTQIPSKPFVPEPMEADLLDSFETLSTLISSLGFPLFVPIAHSSSEELLHLNGEGFSAVGELDEDGFVVHAGAKFREQVSAGVENRINSIRKQLIEDGILHLDCDELILMKNHLFTSPSSAGMVVRGRSSNGWLEWKDANGKTMDEIYRSDILDTDS